MKKHLLLINGLKRSGKDYSADKIISYVGEKNSERISFAGPIKQIIAETFEIGLDELEDYKNDTDSFGIEIKAYPNNQPEAIIKYTNFRTILQRFGTEAMKPIFGDNVWAQKAMDSVIDSEKEWNIITDFRFLSEYKEAKKASEKYNFEVISINIINDDLPAPDYHASEMELKDNNFKFDFVINNTGQPDITYLIEDIIENIKARDISIS